MPKWILRMTLTLLLYSASVAGDISLADCDFEHDLCHYQQLPSTGTTHDDLDWTRHKGPGASHWAKTGPANDHTLGNANGYYIYLVSSYSNHGKKATLVSPAIQAESAQSCLTFWYNMYGVSMGTLDVIIATPHLQNVHVVWEMTGNQGQDWKMANVSIDTSHPFEIVFTSIQGPLATSDMALDDIKLTCGPCGSTCPPTTTTTPTNITTTTPTATTIDATTTTTTTSTSPYQESLADCDFEQGDLCGYRQVSPVLSHDANWTLTQGQAAENSTGPGDDHTLHNGHGHYMYVEQDWTSQYGTDRAIIVSPPINNTSPQSCLTFWYNMNARNVLRVLTATPHLQHARTVWTMHGNVSMWEMANITLNTSQPFEIVFFGDIIRHTPNYIAIDDITLTNGDCDDKVSSTTPTTTPTTTTTPTPTTTTTTPTTPTTTTPPTTTTTTPTTTPTTPTTSPYRVVADKFCVDTVRCPFELDTCDFLASPDWTLYTSPNGNVHERFDNAETDSSALRSPVLCNGPVHVQLTSLITMVTSQHAELILLTECSDDDLWGQPMQGLRGPMTSWQVHNFTLPPCPDGQIQRAVFRVLQTFPGSVFLLDDIVLSTTGGCNRELECHFEQSSCGFHGSSDWTLYSGQGGRSQRFDNVLSDSNSLRSPVVCNGEVHVQFRSHVTTVIGQHAELVVLTECDGEDLWGQPFQGLRGPTASWDTYNFTLSACPDGQKQKVLIRVLRETPGSVFWIDDIFVTR